MKRLFVGFVLGCLTLHQAVAADMALKAPPPVLLQNWTGFYAGIEGGGAWGHHSFINAAGVDTGSKLDGGLVGGDVGYNYQFGSTVVGIEGDLSWADISGSGPCGNPIFSCGAKVNWFGTVRGRVGYVIDRTLLYGTGGFAYGSVDRLNWGNGTSFQPNQTHSGWTLGAGMEYAMTAGWSIRAEYLYVDLGNDTYPGTVFPGLALYAPAIIDARFHVLRAALNWRF